MTSSEDKAKKECVAVSVSFTEDRLCLVLKDEREIRVPLRFYPRLLNATADQRNNYRLIGNGTGIHWPDLDEDLSVESVVEGKGAVG